MQPGGYHPVTPVHGVPVPAPEPSPDTAAFRLFDAGKGEPAELSQAVFLAVGAASMCWEKPEGAGVFESGRAVEVAEQLLEWVRAHYQMKPDAPATPAHEIRGEVLEVTLDPPRHEYRQLREFVAVQKHGPRGWRLHTVTRDDDNGETVYIMERASA